MNIPKWLYSLLFTKEHRLLKHVLFWMFIYADELLSFVGITAPLESNLGIISLEIIGDMLMVYLSLYYLVPYLLFKNKIVRYIVGSILLVAGIVLFDHYIYGADFGSEYLVSSLVSEFVTNSSLLFMAVAMKMMSQSHEDSNQILALREDKLQTELAYLKTQVNPHFLFNTLNNVYVMSKKKDDKVPETIMQLSELLRYQLYECSGDTVSIKNEISYLKNYIKLEQLRRGSLVVDLKLNVENLHMPIRPLIFLPFIENAFKYSNTNSGSDLIKILFEKKDNKLIFSCKNNKGTLHSGVSGGIGLENATRRLELSYPKKHELKIIDEEKTFTVHVEIDIE